jgi:indole-3-glycerol phosphate synthase
MKPLFIAEVKTQSPFGFFANKSWDELFNAANQIGDVISIHTNPLWGGSFDHLMMARRMTNKPILAKGIHRTDEEISKAVDIGADFVLVVGRIPTIHQKKLLIEPNTLEELKLIPSNLKAVWNSRNLENGLNKSTTFSEARNSFSGWLCQASNIKSKTDIDDSADAVLVGTNLLNFLVE